MMMMMMLKPEKSRRVSSQTSAFCNNDDSKFFFSTKLYELQVRCMDCVQYGTVGHMQCMSQLTSGSLTSNCADATTADDMAMINAPK